jgi:DNA modification methylase
MALIKENDVVLDPFMGSGTTAIAAIRNGRQFIGFEKEQSYFDAAQIRIKKAQEQGKLDTWF